MTETFSAADVIRYLLRFKWLIVGLSAFTAIGTYVYTRTLPEYFKATINCVPPSEDVGGIGGALGGISSTLKDIGLSKLGGKKGDSYEFITILFTRTIRDSMIKRFDLVSEYDLAGEPMMKVRDEFEKNLEVNFHTEGNYEISVWSSDRNKAVEMAKGFVYFANQQTINIKKQEAERSVTYLEKRIAMIDSTLEALTDSLGRYSKQYRLFSPLDQATASATGLADAKSELLKQETILGILEQNYGKDDPQVRNSRNLVEQLKNQYENAQTQPGFAGNFALTDAAGLGASYMRLLAEFEANIKLKAFMMPSLEQTRLDVNKAAPALLIIDYPVVPERRDKPKRLLVASGSGLGVGVLTILFLLGIQGWRTMMHRRNDVA